MVSNLEIVVKLGLFVIVVYFLTTTEFCIFGHLKAIKVPSLKKDEALAGVFYNVKNGSSFIMSKSLSKNLSNLNKHLWWYYKNSSFWHFDSHFVLKTKIPTSVCYDCWEFLTNFLTYFLTTLLDSVQNSSYWIQLSQDCWKVWRCD